MDVISFSTILITMKIQATSAIAEDPAVLVQITVPVGIGITVKVVLFQIVTVAAAMVWATVAVPFVFLPAIATVIAATARIY